MDDHDKLWEDFYLETRNTIESFFEPDVFYKINLDEFTEEVVKIFIKNLDDFLINGDSDRVDLQKF